MKRQAIKKKVNKSGRMFDYFICSVIHICKLLLDIMYHIMKTSMCAMTTFELQSGKIRSYRRERGKLVGRVSRFRLYCPYSKLVYIILVVAHL